jgi:hypothetical protein
MSEYRVYYVGSDGKFEGFRALDCDDDSSAVAYWMEKTSRSGAAFVK